MGTQAHSQARRKAGPPAPAGACVRSGRRLSDAQVVSTEPGELLLRKTHTQGVRAVSKHRCQQ